MQNQILDFDEELGTLDPMALAKSAGLDPKQMGKDALGKLGLPSSIPGIGSITALISGVSSGDAKQISSAVGGTGGSVIGAVFGGPVGGQVGEAIGSLVGTLVGGVIPKSKKGKRKVREHARIARDLQSLAKTPLTDDNIVSMVEKGKVVFTNSTDIHGWDVPGQPSGPFIIHMVWNAAKGKLKPISQAKTKAFKASGKGVNLESNMVSKKILASYRAVKSGVKGAALAQEQADTHTKHLTERAVREALSKAGISKASLAKVVRGDANKLARFNRQLARDIAKRAASEARAHHLDHITLGRLTTAAAVGDRSAAAKLNRLAKAIEKSAVVPNRYQNIMGGKGLLELIKNG